MLAMPGVPDSAICWYTCSKILDPVGVGASSHELPVCYVWLVLHFDGWLVDGFKDLFHIQVSVVMPK